MLSQMSLPHFLAILALHGNYKMPFLCNLHNSVLAHRGTATHY